MDGSQVNEEPSCLIGRSEYRWRAEGVQHSFCFRVFIGAFPSSCSFDLLVCSLPSRSGHCVL